MAAILGKDIWRDGLAPMSDDQPFSLFDGAVIADDVSTSSAGSTTNSGAAANDHASSGAPPVVVINDHSLPVDHWMQIQNWMSYIDGENDAAVYYQFMDGGAAAGSGQFWTPSGGYQEANTTLTIDASNLSNVWVGGATATGTETMSARAFDGSNWSDWDTFNFTAVTNSAPTVNVTDHSLAVDHWEQVQNWFSVSDANGDAATMYEFYDTGSDVGSGQFWTPSGGFQAADTVLTVAPADLHNVWIGGATTAGTETMYIRAFDGTDWSNWTSFDFTAQPNTPPTATLGDFLLFPYTWAQVTAFGGPSYSDPDGDPAVLYQFLDSGNVPGGARLWSTDGGFQAAGTALTVAAADIGNVYVGGGPDSPNNEHMYVRAYDGHDWGAWDLFDVRGFSV